MFLLNLASVITSASGPRNYDYDKKYDRDKQGDELAENARIWNVYLDEAESYDMDMIEGFRNNIDGLLVFAALFSAVVTTFVAQTSQSLQPDNAQITAFLLYENNQILRAAGNRTSIDAVPRTALVPGSRTHSLTDLWVNGLFFTSLALSLSTALLTVLAKQWIQAYTVVVSGSAKTRAQIRNFRFQGLIKYKLSEVIESLPLILHSSVAIFFVGLALYVSQLSSPICGVVSAITALTFVFYFGTSMLPAFDIACPYRIPFIFSLAKPLVFAFCVARYAYFRLLHSNIWGKCSKRWSDISAFMCSLAKPLVFAFSKAGLLYFKLQGNFFTWIKNYQVRNTPSIGYLCCKKYSPKWPEVSLKKAEQKQVDIDISLPAVAASHACELIAWVFNHSSNKSVKSIVVGAVCALLEEWKSKELFQVWYFNRVVSRPDHSSLFLSVAKYSLSQLLNIPEQSPTEQNLGQSIYSRFLRNLMKISSSKSLFDGGITTLKDWQEEIEPLWIRTYIVAFERKHHTLSQCILDWGKPLSVQSQRNFVILFFCAQQGHEEDICNLADQGMNLSLCDESKHGWTALHEAALCGNLDTVTALSQLEPGLMSQTSDYHSQKPRTALEVAIQHCKPDVVAYLLDHGAQAPSNALHDAVTLSDPFNKRLETVQLLLDHGWDRTAKDENGKTPIDVVNDWPNWHYLNKPAVIECLENYPTKRSSQSEPTAVPTSKEEEK